MPGGGVAVQNGDADLELRDLAVKVPRHEPLAQQLHAVHLCLDAAPAVISAPSSPERAAQMFRGAQGFVSGHDPGGDGLPRLRIPAGRDDGRSAALGNGVVALACVVGAVRRDAADLPVLRDLAEQVG